MPEFVQPNEDSTLQKIYRQNWYSKRVIYEDPNEPG